MSLISKGVHRLDDNLLRNLGLRVARAITRSESGLRIILMYHSVGSKLPIGIATEQFLSHLEALRRAFSIVTLSELIRRRDRSSENLAALTFDDGYEDNFLNAVPALDKFGFPGTFFVCSGLMGGTMAVRGGSPLSLMCREEVRALAQRGHEIGAHTRTHPMLPELTNEAARDEVRGSKADLEDLIAGPVHSFAYPRGKQNESIRRIVADSGFKQAVGVTESHVTCKADLYLLPRVYIHKGLSPKAFEAKLSNGLHTYNAVRTFFNK